MQLCDKLCKKFFHSGFGKSDFEENTEVQNIQLISNTRNPLETLNFKPLKHCEAPSVNLIQPTPNQSPSRLEKEMELNTAVTENSPQNNDINESDIVLNIEEQQEPLEPSIEKVDLDYRIELEPNFDYMQMELDTQKTMYILDKSLEDEHYQEDEMEEKKHQCDNQINEFRDTPRSGLSDEDEIEDVDDNSKRLETKYGDLGGELILLNLPNPRLSNCNFGFKLSGNKNLNTMSVFICQITPNSLVDIDGRLKVGDEILEIDDHIIFGRSHLNATPILKACNQKYIKFVIHRSVDWLSNMAIPVTYRSLEEFTSNPSSRRNSIMDYLIDKDYCQSRKVSSVSLGQNPTYTTSISTEEAHIIYLNKGSQGFGFAIMEGSFTKEKGIYIKHIAPNGPAAQDGSLRPGDKLISINNQDMTTASYETALELLKGSKGQVRLVVTRVRCAHSPTHSITSPVKTLYQKRLSAPHIVTVPSTVRPITPTIFEEQSDQPQHGISIKTIPESESGLTMLAKTMTDLNARRRSSLSNLPSADVVTLIMNHLSDDANVEVVTLKRFTKPLGISIIGGSDTFIGDVIVHDIFSNGVIALDGRIKIGDRILMINDNQVVDKTNEEVITLLQTSCPEICLKIRHPDSPIQDQDIYEVVTTVELMKKPLKGLGISVIGREGAKGVYICEVLKGGVAEIDGRIEPGDQILEINGEDFRNSTQEEAAITLKCLMGSVVLKIGRIQKMSLHYTPKYLMPKDENGDHHKSLGKFLTPNGAGHSQSRSAAGSPAHTR